MALLTDWPRSVTQTDHVLSHKLTTFCHTNWPRSVTQTDDVLSHKLTTFCHTNWPRSVTQIDHVLSHKMPAFCHANGPHSVADSHGTQAPGGLSGISTNGALYPHKKPLGVSGGWCWSTWDRFCSRCSQLAYRKSRSLTSHFAFYAGIVSACFIFFFFFSIFFFLPFFLGGGGGGRGG